MNESATADLKRTVKLAVRVIILALVIWGIWRAGRVAYGEWTTRTNELRAKTERLEKSLQKDPTDSQIAEQLHQAKSESSSLQRIEIRWLLLAGVLYIAGLLPSWWFWHQAMRRMNQRPNPLQSLWAYFLGHLGKYVPGKALVVIIRSTTVAGPDVRVAAAALSVFVETLTMIAVGGFVAAAILACLTSNRFLVVVSFALACVAAIPIVPAVFQRMVRTVRKNSLTDELQQWVGNLDLKFLVSGWLAIGIGWFALGGSLWATMRSLPVIEPLLNTPDSWIIATGCAALAMVGGFVSLLPGGLGVREWVVMAVLTPRFGPIAAFAAAGLLRLVWLLSELAICAVLWLAQRYARRP